MFRSFHLILLHVLFIVIVEIEAHPPPPFEPLRIEWKVDKNYHIVDDALKHVKMFFENLLKVRRTTVSGCSDCDLLVTVNIDDCSSTSTYASASHSSIDKYNRPTKGDVTVCKQKIALKGKHIAESLYKVLLHELMHILVLSSSHFDNFVNRTHPDIKLEKVTEKKTQDWKAKNGAIHKHSGNFFTKLPKLNEEMKKYTGCDDHPGIEIEDEGKGGTAGSHFDKRIFGPEVMTGETDGRGYFSQFSAAMLEDSGWYEVNRDAKDFRGNQAIEPLENGWFNKEQGGGCVFVNKGCRDFVEHQKKAKKSYFPFCHPDDLVPFEENIAKISKTDRCTPDHTAYMTCNFKTNTKTTEEIRDGEDTSDPAYTPQLFDEKYEVEGLTNNCPVELPINIADGKNRKGDTNCQNSENTIASALNYNAESFGIDSYCFDGVPEVDDHNFLLFTCDMTGLTPQIKRSSRTGAGCYKTKCVHGRLHVQPQEAATTENSRWLTCYGDMVRISRVQQTDPKVIVRGYLKCPPCQVVCGSSFKCEPKVPGITPSDRLVGCIGGTAGIKGTPRMMIPILVAFIFLFCANVH